ncbi:MAG: hypothetical protein FWC24_05935, partial [Treponema sp.]|nr:hypothetical protein [Treponema sp.]
MMRLCFFFVFFFLGFTLSAQTSTAPGQRSFDEIFPGIPSNIRTEAFSSSGFCRSTGDASPSAIIGSGQSDIDPRIIEAVLIKKPGFLVESILVIPGKTGKYSLLDVYNALGRIRRLKGRHYHSFTRNEYVPLFEDATRIESSKKNNSIADPAPAVSIPPSET